MPTPFSSLKFLSLFTGHDPPEKQEQEPEPILIEPPPGLEKIVPGYLSARREDVAKMTALLAASDFPGLAVLGHNLKGNGASYGFPELTRIGNDLMQSAVRQDKIALGDELTELARYLVRVRVISRNSI
jgi:hypothetical protein